MGFVALPISQALLVLAGLDLVLSPWAFVALPAGACLVAGWRLLIALFIQGEPGLRATSMWHWILLQVS